MDLASYLKQNCVVQVQKLPEFCRQLKLSRISGVCSVLSGFFTVTTNTSAPGWSFAIPPNRGSGMTGHITHLGPCPPDGGLTLISTKPLACKSSISACLLMSGVPSRSD